MRLLVDVLHPAHVHFFRNTISEVTARGGDVLVTARDKEVTLDLLEAYDIPHLVLSRQSVGALGLAGEWVGRTARLASVARRFAPDLLVGIMGVSIAPVGRLLRTPSLVFYDTEAARQTNRVVYPMATEVLTPDCYQAPLRANQATYPGYHELAYLHPNRFTPRADALASFGLSVDEPFTVVRFVSWESSHDGAEIALTREEKVSLVERLGSRSRVVVSSEGPLPAAVEPLRLQGPVEDVHHVMSFARAYVGESPTMATEAAVLGTPGVHIAQTSRGYVDDIERRYGLIRHFQPRQFDEAAEAAVQLLEDPRPGWAADARDRLLSEKIDVTDWVLGRIEAYAPHGTV
jgi:predicted glycosyltransferase